ANVSANVFGAEATAYFWLKFLAGVSSEISFPKGSICQKNAHCSSPNHRDGDSCNISFFGRACLVGEIKIFGCHIGRLTGCRKGFSDTNEKTNFITRLETARRIF
ncbi:hypothetical protein M3J57_28320, partial [Klebsiella pneumoniae]|nr:hypothetical protein [Klebsiella pneumoniae]